MQNRHRSRKSHLEPHPYCRLVMSWVVSVVCVATLGSGAVAVAGVLDADRVDPDRTVRATAVPVEPAEGKHAGARWGEVLGQLDGWRARAWARGAPDLLRKVYLPGSAVLAQDRHHLAAYVRRGLRVNGVTLSFGQIRVLGRSDHRVTLEVVDSLGAMTAASQAGVLRQLPHDLPTTHQIVLAQWRSEWRIAGVRAV